MLQTSQMEPASREILIAKNGDEGNHVSSRIKQLLKQAPRLLHIGYPKRRL